MEAADAVTAWNKAHKGPQDILVTQGARSVTRVQGPAMLVMGVPAVQLWNGTITPLAHVQVLDETEAAIENARTAYATHRIAMENETRACIEDPRDPCHLWAELILGAQGTLIVHGDGPDIMFRFYRPNATLRSVVHAVANGGFGYLFQKVVGGADSGSVYSWRKAQVDVQAIIDEGEESMESLAALRELASCFHWDECSEDELRRDLYDALDEPSETRVGRRPSDALIYGRAACTRLVALWEQR